MLNEQGQLGPRVPFITIFRQMKSGVTHTTADIRKTHAGIFSDHHPEEPYIDLAAELHLTRVLHLITHTPSRETENLQLGYSRQIVLTGLIDQKDQPIVKFDSLKIVFGDLKVAKFRQFYPGGIAILETVGPGKTTLELELMADGLPYLMSIPIEVWAKKEDPEKNAFSEALQRRTSLQDVTMITDQCSVAERKVVLKAIRLLQAGQKEGLDSIYNLTSLSAYAQSLLLLHIPRIGTALALQVVKGVENCAMDGRDFEGNDERAVRYGVDLSKPHKASFSLKYSDASNRNVFQDLHRCLTPEILSRSVGITIEEFLTSSNDGIAELRSLLEYMTQWATTTGDSPTHRQKLEKARDAFYGQEKQIPLTPQVTSESIEPSSKCRRVELSIPFEADLEYVSVALRNTRGHFVRTKRIYRNDSRKIVFDNLHADQKLTVTVSGTTFNGQKRVYQTLSLS